MPRTQQVKITCPRCQQPFVSDITTIIEADDDVLAERLAAGELNKIDCPTCPFQGMVSYPVVYHDRQHRVLLAAIPGLEAMGEEDVWNAVGEDLQWVVGAMPPARQNDEYLYHPRLLPTLEILSGAVSALRRGVDADTAIRAVYRSQLLQALLMTGKDVNTRRALFRESPDLADEEMLGILNSMIDESLRDANLSSAARLTDVRDDLATHLRNTTGLRRIREHVEQRRPDLDSTGLTGSNEEGRR